MNKMIILSVILAIIGLVLVLAWCISLLLNSGAISKEDRKWVKDIDGKKHYPRRGMK